MNNEEQEKEVLVNETTQQIVEVNEIDSVGNKETYLTTQTADGRIWDFNDQITRISLEYKRIKDKVSKLSRRDRDSIETLITSMINKGLLVFNEDNTLKEIVKEDPNKTNEEIIEVANESENKDE